MIFGQILHSLENNNQSTIEFYRHKNKIKKKFSDVAYDVKKVIEYLKDLNIELLDRIGINSENCYEYVLLDLACLHLGLTSVHFHKNHSNCEFTEIMEKHTLKFLFHDDIIYDDTVTNNNIFLIDNLLQNVDSVDISDKSYPFQYNEKFTIVFSSGTTGEPKGMWILSDGIEEFCSCFIKRYKLTSEDKILNTLPFSIITSRMYLYSCILGGINIVFSYTEELSNSLQLYKPTFFQSVPYLFEGLYKSFQGFIKSSSYKYICYKLFCILNPLFPDSLKTLLQRKLFKEIHSFWGGKMRILATGSAPINKKVLIFFNNVGIPLYEAYGVTEIGIIATNIPGNFKIGSVGRIFGNKEIIFDKNKQILIKTRHPFSSGYLDDFDENNSHVFRDDGLMATGDVGYLDKEGYLFLNGRIKDIIILLNGNKIFPNKAEIELENSNAIEQCALFGDNKPYLIAVIVIKKNIDYNSIDNVIKKFNETSGDCQIKNFLIIQDGFSLENGLLSLNMKKNRISIYQKYKDQIDKLY